MLKILIASVIGLIVVVVVAFVKFFGSSKSKKSNDSKKKTALQIKIDQQIKEIEDEIANCKKYLKSQDPNRNNFEEEDIQNMVRYAGFNSGMFLLNNRRLEDKKKLYNLIVDKRKRYEGELLDLNVPSNKPADHIHFSDTLRNKLQIVAQQALNQEILGDEAKQIIITNPESMTIEDQLDEVGVWMLVEMALALAVMSGYSETLSKQEIITIQNAQTKNWDQLMSMPMFSKNS